MKILRAILTGFLIWLSILTLFTVFSFVPSLMDEDILQGVIVGVLIIPVAIVGAKFYYRVGNMNGFTLAFIMVLMGILLDAFITVPFIEIPYNQSSYVVFFGNPILWILIVEYIAIIVLYWQLKIRPLTFN